MTPSSHNSQECWDKRFSTGGRCVCVCARHPQRPEGSGKGGGVRISSADGGSSLCGSMMDNHVLKNFLLLSKWRRVTVVAGY